jgi:hypothetical protein
MEEVQIGPKGKEKEMKNPKIQKLGSPEAHGLKPSSYS